MLQASIVVVEIERLPEHIVRMEAKANTTIINVARLEPF